jgi:GMP synthase (glutamine-hydrolysing)
MRSRGEDGAEGSASWIVLRHSAAEGLGLLGNVLRELGIHHRKLDLAGGQPPPKDMRSVGGLIVLGGSMAAYETDGHPFLKDELALIEQAITAGRPALGICLGAQLIAQVLGSRVYPGTEREVGWGTVTLTEDARDDPLLLDHGPTLDVFHLHGDTYDLPADAHHLARSDRYEQQAFEWGGIVYGLQFHLEFTESIFERLAADPDSARYMRDAGLDPAAVAAESPARVQAIADLAQDVFRAYFQHCGV